MEKEGKLWFEKQACNGLSRWAENFDKVIVACPTLTASVAEQRMGMQWLATESIEHVDRIEFVPLPASYKIRDFLRDHHAVSVLLRENIQKSDYLSFAISGLFGDWAAIACLEARKIQRQYSVWTDRVEHKVILKWDKKTPIKRKIKNLTYSPVMKFYHQHLIKHSGLGLFHGEDCYQAYAPYCSNSHVVHDIHVKKHQHINKADLITKIQSLDDKAPLKICYVGRAEAMKGPLDWIQIVRKVVDAGVNLEAIWFGEGTQLNDMKSKTEDLIKSGHLTFAGYVGDQNDVLSALRSHHVLMFCHKTPESPRNLIEALISGCPIIGYRSPYPTELIAINGGGILLPTDDIDGVTETIIALNRDRNKLKELIKSAADDGRKFTDEEVFRHRSQLIYQHL